MSDLYTIITPADESAVAFSEASAWCRDINIADTDLVEGLITAATLIVESQTNRVFIQRTINAEFDCFNSSKFEPKLFVELRRAPLISVTSVTVNGTVLPSTDYIIKNSSSFTRILFQNSFVLDTDVAYAISVLFIAGYAVVPKDLIIAIEQIVLYWYENRGDVSADEDHLPKIAKQIIKQNRILNTFG